MELMLLGVGACASYDVVMILKKSRQAVTGCVARLEAHQEHDPPRVFTRMHLHFVVTGHDLSLRKVTRAVRLSVDTYCPASITLQRSGVVVEHSVEVVHEAQPG